MAKLASIASGSFTGSSTWGVINEQSFQAGAATTNQTSVTTSFVSLGTFVPSSTITVSDIGIRLKGATITGTFSAQLFNVTANSAITDSTVTVNTSSFNFDNLSSISGSWYSFKLPSNITLTSGVSYAIRVLGSIAGNTLIMSTTNGSPTTAHRFLITTTNQAPASTDDLWVMSEWVTGSTVNEITVTMDNTTSATTFGSGAANFGGINLSTNSYLSYGTNASTNYYLRLNGFIWLGCGAYFSMGTTGNTIPSTSTAVLEFSGSGQGFNTISTGQLPSQFHTVTVLGAGVNPTYPYALLSADVASGATTFTTNVSTDWKNGDQIVLAGTGAVATGQDLRTMSGDASGTTVRVSATLTNAHGGSGDIVAEVINLTRNVKIRNSSGSQGVMTLNNVLMNFQGVEISSMGIVTFTGNGEKRMEYSSYYNSNYITNGAIFGSNVQINYNCFYNCPYFFIGPFGNINATAVDSSVITNSISFNYFILATGASTGTATSITLLLDSYNFIGNRMSGLNGSVGGSIGTGSLIFYTTASLYGERIMNGIVSGNTLHSSVAGIGASTVAFLRIYDFNVWRISSTYTALSITSADNLKFYNCNFYGNANASGQAVINSCRGIEFVNCNFRAGTTITASRGVGLQQFSETKFQNCTFGTGQTHSTGDVIVSSAKGINAIFENCVLSSPTKFSSLTNIYFNSAIKLQRYQQINNNNYTYTTLGNSAQYDGTIFKTGNASTRLVPLTTTFKLQSPYKTIPISSGSSATISVWVRKSSISDISGTNYFGSQPRLILGYSPSVFNYTGQTDQVLSTMTGSTFGVWQELTATIPYTAYTNGGFQVYVDCDGTAGWINIDDWSVT